MKKIIFALFLLFLPFSVQAKDVTLYFFHGDGCPHCADEEEYLKELSIQYPEVEIIKYEVWHNDENSTFLNEVKEELNLVNPYVPFTVIGEKGITGFGENTKFEIEEQIKYCKKNKCQDAVSIILETGEFTPSAEVASSIKVLPIIGKVDVRKVSLPFVTILLGFIDGFNPCAMWILIFLITLLLGTKDHKKMLLLGSIFLAISGIFYFLILTAWLKITISVRSIIWLRSVIAVLAIGIGFYQLQHTLLNKEVGCEVTNEKQRRKLMEKMKSIVSKPNIWLSLIGMIFLAVTVNLIEMACSAGLPLLFTQILSLNNVTGMTSIIYMILYVLFYLIDDIILFSVAVMTHKVVGISNRYSRYIKIVGGSILLIMGILLLIKPEWVMLNF